MTQNSDSNTTISIASGGKFAMKKRDFRFALARELENYPTDALELAVEELATAAGAKFKFKNGAYRISMYGRKDSSPIGPAYAIRNWIRATLLQDAPVRCAA